jgi:hypothetical protein
LRDRRVTGLPGSDVAEFGTEILGAGQAVDSMGENGAVDQRDVQPSEPGRGIARQAWGSLVILPLDARGKGGRPES